MEQNTNTIGSSSRLRALNDAFRSSGIGVMTVVTPGIAALPNELARKVYEAVASFADFNPDNDPWSEHDCAVLKVDEHSIIWKIDYYDRQRRYLSPDPADPKVTVRVLTIMLSEEY